MSRKKKRPARESRPLRQASPRRGVSWKPGRWLFAGAFVTMVGIIGFLLWRGSAPPVVAVNTEGFDPFIADAIERARKAVLDEPRSAAACGRMGMVLMAHEIQAEACECFSQAMAMEPHVPRWPYFLGLTQLADNPAAAVANLERAVRLFPERESVPRLKLADALLELGRRDEASELYQHVLDREPDSAPAALGLGKVANARDSLPEAADYLAAATRDPTTRKAAHRLLLTVNQRLGRTNEVKRISGVLAELPNDEALSDRFLSEVELLKTGEEVWVDRADEWIKVGRAKEAARLLDRTIQAYPNSDRAMFFLGRARLRLGDAAGAESILMKAVELDPDSVEAQMQLGIVRLTRGRAREAQPCFRAAIKAKPNLGEAWFNLALSLGSEADRSECIAAFREAIRLKPNLSEAYVGLAVALRANGQREAAARELRRALELDPADPLRRKVLDQLELVE